MDGLAHIRDAPQLDTPVDFLKRLYPAVQWAITAIVPDGSGIETKVFGPDTEAALREFLRSATAAGTSTTRSTSLGPRSPRKRRRPTSVRAHFLHLDVDPKDDETPKEAKERALEALEAYRRSPRRSSTAATASRRCGACPSRSRSTDR